MASTYSPNLRLELIGTGEQQGTWGATTNTNLGTLLEEAIGGYASVTVSDVADTTLTTSNGSADQARNMVLNLTGSLTGTRNVICPAIEKLYVVKNATSGSQSVVFKVSGQTGVTIANGSTAFIYVDGTDARSINGSIASQNSNNVSITGGSITGITDLAIADGGTGASDAATARTNLGLGTANNVQFNTIEIGNASDTTLNRVSAGVAAIEGKNIALNGTTETLTTGTIELGDASDTTISRVSAGVVAVEGVNLVRAGAVTTSGLTQNTSRILGRTTASVGAIEEITVGTGLSLSAGSLSATATATTGALIRAPQVLTSGTSYTTPAGCNSIYVECVGAGGGGGGADVNSTNDFGAGGGGGSGGYAAKYFSVSPSTAYTYAIGSAGTAGSNTGGTGGSGGSTTFTVSATTVTAGGGAGGVGVSAGGVSITQGEARIGGVGGTSSNGDLNISGTAGTPGSINSEWDATRTDFIGAFGGTGGSCFFGGGGRGGTITAVNTSSAGSAGTFGGGGGGGSCSATAGITGGAGGAGIIRIWEFT